MASNPYFNFFNNHNEQNLMENLIVEGNRQYAHDIIYLPRDIPVVDEFMTEPVIQVFDKPLSVEVFVNNFDSFEGEGSLLSKFGLEIRDQMTLTMTHRTFKETIQPITGRAKPFEGDCLYIPMLKAVYQIKYASSSDSQFYLLGKNYAWRITCELLEYNNEQFRTGIPEIDSLYPAFENNVTNPDYDINNYDKTAMNDLIQVESDKIIDWSVSSPFGEE